MYLVLEILSETHEENVRSLYLIHSIVPLNILRLQLLNSSFFLSNVIVYIIQKLSDPARAHRLKLEVICQNT